MPIILLASLWFAPFELPLIILEEQIRLFFPGSTRP
jgi:hypothetical protein